MVFDQILSFFPQLLFSKLYSALETPFKISQEINFLRALFL